MASKGYTGHTTTVVPGGNVVTWGPFPQVLEDVDLKEVYDVLFEVMTDDKCKFIEWYYVSPEYLEEIK